MFLDRTSWLILASTAILGVAFTVIGCTLSVSVVATHGPASDIIDEYQSIKPDINADLTIPAF